MAKKFQDLTVDYTTLMKMSVTDRLTMISSSSGRNLLSDISPEQLASLFPTYYLKKLPEIGVGHKGAGNPLSRSYGNHEGAEPSWATRQKEISRSDPSDVARLTRDQKEVFELLKKGKIEVDDPRVKFLDGIKEDELARFGIEKKDGKYGMTPATAASMSDAEIAKTVGNHRPTYSIRPDDLSDDVIRTIAGEAIVSNQQSLDAVINNMMNRVGGKGYASTFAGVARQSGQYEGYNKGRISDEQAEKIRDRIKQIASGQVPDNTGGANEFRAGTYVFGEGQGKSFYRDAQKEGFRQPGGSRDNVYARRNNYVGPYSPYEITGEKAPNPDSITPEMVEAQRKRLIDQQHARQEAALAARLNGSTGAIRNRDIESAGPINYASESVRARADYLAPETSSALQRLNAFVPGVKINSTYRSPQHEIEAKKIAQGRPPGMHTRGMAVDVGTQGKSREELAETIRGLKRAGFNNVLLEGDPPHIHAEVRPGQNFRITNLGNGHPDIPLDFAREAASSVRYMDDLPSVAAKETTVKQSGTSAEPSNPQISEGEVKPQVASNETKAGDNVKKEGVSAEPEAPHIPVRAKGGDVNVNADEIKALPIGGTKGDNSVVVDNNANPLFTMNTKRESANYDPESGQVSVKPKTDGDGLKEPEKAPSNDQTTNVDPNTPLVNQGYAAQSVMPNRYSPSGLDLSKSMTESVFKDPSFERAIAKSRFVSTGDSALGGHFDSGASNLA